MTASRSTWADLCGGRLQDALEGISGSTSSRGEAFERLCLWMLRNAPTYRLMVEEVWLWRDWPDRDSRDLGIDLVVLDRQGRTWAVQAKYRKPGEILDKTEVNSFLAESARPPFTYRLLITTAVDLSANLLTVLRRPQSVGVGFLTLSDLDALDLQWPLSEDTTPAIRERPLLSPRPHQRVALDAVSAGLAAGARGQLVMPCGTGKTLVGAWLAQELDARTTLVCLPSLSLLAQTVREWARILSPEVRVVCVCSDSSVVSDATVASSAELGIPVTTSASDLSEFLRSSGARVLFSTYQSTPSIEEALAASGETLDLLIADEAHRCAGGPSSPFSSVLDDTRIPAARRVFMTATPRFLVDDHAGRQTVQMEHPTFGATFYRLSFRDAVEQGLLSDYRVLIVGSDDDRVRGLVAAGASVITGGGTLDAHSTAGAVGVTKAMQDHDLRSVITFHSRVKRAADFSLALPAVAAAVGSGSSPSTTYVSGAMTSGIRDRRLAQLRRATSEAPVVIANAQCLAEGVDVPALDAVAFIDARSSQVSIVQAVGRVMRKHPSKEFGYVVVPVLLGDAERRDPDAFRHVWQVLRALRAHDPDLAAALDAYERAVQAGEPTERPDKVMFDLPIHLDRAFIDAISVAVLREASDPWEVGYGLLCVYADREGTSAVPVAYMEGGFALGNWAAAQRSRQQRGLLSQSRIDLLEVLPGWVWEAEATRRGAALAHLLAFVDREGHARVPEKHFEGEFHLGRWVSRCRTSYKNGELDPDLVAVLDELPGWVWRGREDPWDRHYDSLAAFAHREGHTQVPKSFRASDGTVLARWVGEQRRIHRRGGLRPARAKALEALPGWSWGDGREPSLDDPRVQKYLAALDRYLAREGHTNVPTRHVEDGIPLGQWVLRCRGDYRKQVANPLLVQRLADTPGWVWSVFDAAWDENYERLKAYAAETGSCAMPSTYETTDGFGLGDWISKQRRAKKSGRLADWRAKRLEALPGWRWDLRPRRTKRQSRQPDAEPSGAL